jgi:hypothetical protein
LILVAFDVLIFYDAISKIRTSKVFFVGKTFDVLILPMASKKIRTLKVFPTKRLSTFWYYLWRQKRSERQKSNFLWLLMFFSTKWFLTFWSNIWRSDLLDFQRSDHLKKAFDVLTLRCSDFWHSDPLPLNYRWTREKQICFNDFLITFNYFCHQCFH